MIDLEALAIQVASLAARVSRLEERQEDTERQTNIVRRRSDEHQRITDARIDVLYAEQLSGAQVADLLKAVYELGVRVQALEKQ